MDDILFTTQKHLGIVTLNRTKALNALTFDMIKALYQQLQAWELDDSIHAIVVMAAEGRAFCAGGDVRWIYQLGRENQAPKMEFFAHEYRLDYYISTLTKPYIALMNGMTMGGGVGISLHGSHPVATEQFQFAMPETGIGFYPDIGASFLLARCPGSFGTYLGLTGSMIGAFDAKVLGLVRYVMDSSKLTHVLQDLMQLDLSQNAHDRVDELLCTYHQTQSSSPSRIDGIQDQVNTCFYYQPVEGMLGALQSGKDAWHQETLDILQKRAPMSLKVTVDQLQRAKCLSLAECLEMDYGLTYHFMQQSDFFEGVRALLIDKDHAPHWDPNQLSDISSHDVATYFRPVPAYCFDALPPQTGSS